MFEEVKGKCQRMMHVRFIAYMLRYTPDTREHTLQLRHAASPNDLRLVFVKGVRDAF